MNALQLQAHIQQGRAIAFDTNSLWRSGTWRQACGQLRHWARKNDQVLALVVPATVHFEHLIHQRHRFGLAYDERRTEEALESVGLEIVPWNGNDAANAATLLAQAHVDDAAWQSAKIAAAKARFDVDAKTVPTTVDWLIAGQAAASRWILVSNDQGVEFRADVQRIELPDFVAAVNQLVTL